MVQPTAGAALGGEPEDALIAQARYLAGEPELLDKSIKSFVPGFIGFGGSRSGEKALIAVLSHVDRRLPEAIAAVLRERGVKVDLIVIDAGPDREIEEVDEIRAMIRRTVWRENADYDPRRYNDFPWVTELVDQAGYDLLIQGKAYPNDVPFRWEGHPWDQAEQFLSPANRFPRDLHELINAKAWEPVWESGRGSQVNVTDPEGTDLTYTLLPEYWETGGMWFSETPCYGHLMYHPGPPVSPGEDSHGFVAGTMAHFARPFPRIGVHVEDGAVVQVEGGGAYGDGWRELMEETREIHYPQFPRPGLFWLWEVAVGTNPQVERPPRVRTIATGGTEWERWRSGITHIGFGTAGPSPEEEWAAERGHPYGHLHIHQQFPTIELISPSGDRTRTVSDGHLLALEDPEVRELAARYGDPDELLTEVWTPSVPGINAPGEYADYAKDPAAWFPRE